MLVYVHFYLLIPLSVLSFLSPKDLWKIPGKRWWLERETSDTVSLPSEMLWIWRGQYFSGFKEPLLRGKTSICLSRGNDLLSRSARTQGQGWAQAALLHGLNSGHMTEWLCTLGLVLCRAGVGESEELREGSLDEAVPGQSQFPAGAGAGDGVHTLRIGKGIGFLSNGLGKHGRCGTQRHSQP